MSFSDILLKSFREYLKKLTEITKTNHFSILLIFFTKIVGFLTVFIADMNSACKNTLISIFFVEFEDKT